MQTATDDCVEVQMTQMAPPPSVPFVQTFKRAHTCESLRSRLRKTDGTKSDLALRLLKRDSGFLGRPEVASEYTKEQLKERLKAQRLSTAGSKQELVLRLVSSDFFDDGGDAEADGP
jgi:hypothetical protein